MEVVRYRSNTGVSTALVEEGRKWLSLLTMDSGGLTVKRVPKSERRYMTDIDYKIGLAKRKFRSAGRKFGITKAARKFLKG